MRFLKNTVGPLWLVFIFGWYIENHEYYAHSLDFWTWLLGLMVLWMGVFAGIAWVVRAKKSPHSPSIFTVIVTPLRVIIVGLVMVWLTGIVTYALLNPAVFNAPFQVVFTESGTIAVVPEGEELVEGVNATFTRGSVMVKWDNAKNQFPMELQAMFTQKSVLAFAFELAVTLLKTVAWWVFLTMLFYGLGATVWRRSAWNAMDFFKAVGLGLGVMMGVLFALGAVGWMTSRFITGAIVIAFLVGFLHIVFLCRRAWDSRITLTLSRQNAWVVPVLMALGIFLSLNIIDAFTPFPVGFDSLTRYHSTPDLLAQYGRLISGVFAYNIELITSLALFLFKSTFLGLQTSQWINLLTLGLLYKVFTTRFSWEHSLILLLLFVSLPMTNFLMHVDLKTDLPLLFFSLLGLGAIWEWHKKRGHEHQPQRQLMWAGLWFGLAMGIKFTTVNVLIVAFAFMATTLAGIGAGAGVILTGLAALGHMDYLFPFGELDQTVRFWLWNGTGAIGLAVFLLAVFKTKAIRKIAITLAIPAGLIALLIAPWLVLNGVRAHSIALSALVQGKGDEVVINGVEFGIQSGQCVKTYDYNELELYTGVTEGNPFKRTAGVLWESTITSKLKNNRLTDISFLFLGFVVFVLLAWPEIKKNDPDMRPLAAATMVYGVLWLLSANGIVWYGMPLFAGALLIYGKAWKTEKWTYGVIGAWLIMALLFRFSDTVNQNVGLLFSGGITDRSVYMEQSIAGSEAVKTIVNADNALGKNIYLAGRFVDFHILQKDRRVYRDQLLNEFMCVFMHEDPEVSLERLRSKNFGYIILMMDGLGVESDPNGPLHKQFARFETFADQYLIREVYRPGMRLYRIPE